MENQLIAPSADRAIVLLSGGIMSTILTLTLVEKGMDVTALTVVGERGTDLKSRTERQCAIMLCRMYGINHEIVDASSLQAVLHKYTMLEAAPTDIPDDATDEQLAAADKDAIAAMEIMPETYSAMGMQLASVLKTDKVFMGKKTEGADLIAELTRLVTVLQPRLIGAAWTSWKDALTAVDAAKAASEATAQAPAATPEAVTPPAPTV